jgi:hypothetical protein
MTEHRTRLDDAIDRAVRDMLRHEPPAGFRRRVLARLQRTSAGSKAVAPARRTVLWPGLAAAAAAIVIIALVNVFVRDVPQSAVTPRPEVAARVPDNPPPVGIPAPRVEAASSERTGERAGRRAPRREPVRVATFGPRDGRVSATSVRERPLPATTAGQIAVEEPIAGGPPPIAVTPLSGPPPLEITPIVVAPILIPRVQLAPVSPPR